MRADIIDTPSSNLARLAGNFSRDIGITSLFILVLMAMVFMVMAFVGFAFVYKIAS